MRRLARVLACRTSLAGAARIGVDNGSRQWRCRRAAGRHEQPGL